MSAEIHAGAVAPYFLELEIISEDVSIVDLSSATSPEMRALRDDGTTATWTAVFVDPPEPERVLLSYTFQLGDLPEAECLRIEGRVTTLAGLIVAEVRKLLVRQAGT